jgi:hypothetical protein
MISRLIERRGEEYRKQLWVLPVRLASKAHKNSSREY